MRQFFNLTIVTFISILLLAQCSSKNDSGPTSPTPKLVDIKGSLTLPVGLTTALNHITVEIGGSESKPDSLGEFTLKALEHQPGLLIAQSSDSTPVLLSIVADPQSGIQTTTDIQSTALALVFLNPLVCSSSNDGAKDVLTHLEALSELHDLENLLTLKLQADPQALTKDDSEIDQAISNVVIAYLNLYPDQSVAKLLSLSTDAGAEVKSESNSTPPEITPSTSVSGLSLTWQGGNTYQLSNAFGRWAYCCTPQDTFFVFPNGDLLDALKLKKPWSPSKRQFTMQLDPGDTGFVEVFGYGFGPYPGNAWDSLSHTEQNYAHAGGITTVTMELFCNVVSVITNTPRLYGNEKVAQLWSETGWDIIVKNSKYVQRANEYIKANDPYGLSWYLTKQIISETVNSSGYRAFLAETIGLSLGEGAVQRLATWLLLPAKVVVNLNSVASVLKTSMALTTARFAVEFEVTKVVDEFGSVTGQVGDKQSGNAIQGATVNLTGDDNNPLNPTHQTTTDANGHFTFSNIGTGEKSISVDKSGYKSSTVAVTIENGKQTSVDIVLEKQTAGMSGRVLNDIFIHNFINPTSFTGSVDIDVHSTVSQGSVMHFHATDGSYGFSLPTGNWWVIASHDDYISDSFQVNVVTEGAFQAPRDLVLKPKTTMTGTIRLNMDNVGDYEQVFDVDFSQVGISKPATAQDPCPLGGTGQTVMELYAVNGNSQAHFDAIGIGLNTTLITAAGAFATGGIEKYACSGQHVPAAASYVTSKQYCHTQGGESSPLVFAIVGDPEMSGCNCGITIPGNIYIEQWGTDPGDLIVGSMSVSLAGWKTCTCDGNDTNHDGKNDHWDVSCAQARLDIEFRVLVGTDYLITWVPGQSSYLPMSIYPTK